MISMISRNFKCLPLFLLRKLLIMVAVDGRLLFVLVVLGLLLSSLSLVDVWKIDALVAIIS